MNLLNFKFWRFELCEVALLRLVIVCACENIQSQILEVLFIELLSVHHYELLVKHIKEILKCIRWYLGLKASSFFFFLKF